MAVASGNSHGSAAVAQTLRAICGDRWNRQSAWTSFLTLASHGPLWLLSGMAGCGHGDTPINRGDHPVGTGSGLHRQATNQGGHPVGTGSSYS